MANNDGDGNGNGQGGNGPQGGNPTPAPKPPAKRPAEPGPWWNPTGNPLHGGKYVPPKTPAPVPGQGGTGDQQNAFADIQSQLQQYGLGSLATWAWSEITHGRTESEVILDLYNQKAFKDRFPAIFTRQAQGLPPLSPGDYVSYENQATQMYRAAGLPKGFWDSPADFTNLLEGDVSISELQSRLNLATQATLQVPDSVRSVLQRDYGVDQGGLAAHFLDPNAAEPLLAQQFAAAQIGGAAIQTGYGTNKTVDERLAADGVSAAQAQQGFTQLGQEHQLFTGLPGENAQSISQDQQLGAAFEGNAADQQAIALRAAQRQARFAAGGQYASSAAGFSGLGSASQA